MLHGGYLKDIPKPHQRRWRGGAVYSSEKPSTKRSVYFSIATYGGIVPGAYHYFAKVYEEDNPLWNGEGWQIAHDDDGAQGEWFEERFDTVTKAREYVVKIIKKHFPRHKVREGSYIGLPTWYRQMIRTGD